MRRAPQDSPALEEELIYDTTVVRDQISYVHIERSLVNRLWRRQVETSNHLRSSETSGMSPSLGLTVTPPDGRRDCLGHRLRGFENGNKPNPLKECNLSVASILRITPQSPIVTPNTQPAMKVKFSRFECVC